MSNFNYSANAELQKDSRGSSWYGQPQYMQVTVLYLTGGSSLESLEQICVRRVDRISSSTFTTFKRYDGKEITINPKFIVKTENLKLARVSLRNDREGTTTTKYVLIDDDKTLKLLN